MNKKIISLLLCFCLISFYPISIFAYSNYIWSSSLDSVYTNSTEENSVGNSLNLESGAAVLIEQNSGKVLYEKNMHEQLRPACQCNKGYDNSSYYGGYRFRQN